MQNKRWGLLVVCHHHKPCDHKHCDIIYLTSHVLSRERMFKKLCEFMDGNHSRRFATLICLATIGVAQVEIKSI